MLSELKELFSAWIAGTAAAIDAVLMRLVPQRRIELVEVGASGFTARLAPEGKAKAVLPPTSFRLVHGRPDPALGREWQAALRGSRIEVLLQPDQMLFRAIDFPRQASDFLDGMVRAQIDRLTPWTASEAMFGITAPEPVANERIALTLVATSRQKVQPLLRLAADVGAASVTGLVDIAAAAGAPARVQIFRQTLQGAAGLAIDVPRLLRRMLLGSCVAAAATLAIAAYVNSQLEAERQELQQRITQRRAALRLNQGKGSAETLLAKRKQTSPSSVMVLEAASRALPDTTYVTELRIEGDKVQVVGLTQDAPSLVKLMEQSPQFSRATFFAPTTRAQNDPGERFHIEAQITPYFGSGS
jgi:general secretion pathway protein L